MHPTRPHRARRRGLAEAAREAAADGDQDGAFNCRCCGGAAQLRTGYCERAPANSPTTSSTTPSAERDCNSANEDRSSIAATQPGQAHRRGAACCRQCRSQLPQRDIAQASSQQPSKLADATWSTEEDLLLLARVAECDPKTSAQWDAVVRGMGRTADAAKARLVALSKREAKRRVRERADRRSRDTSWTETGSPPAENRLVVPSWRTNVVSTPAPRMPDSPQESPTHMAVYLPARFPQPVRSIGALIAAHSTPAFLPPALPALRDLAHTVPAALPAALPPPWILPRALPRTHVPPAPPTFASVSSIPRPGFLRAGSRVPNTPWPNSRPPCPQNYRTPGAYS